MKRNKINILGISNTPVSGAVLISGGKIVAAVSEERFTRRKNDNSFPEHSLRYVLREAGLQVKDIDFVATGCWKGIDVEGYLCEFFSDVVESIKNYRASKSIIFKRIQVALSRDAGFKNILLEKLCAIGFKHEQVFFYDHHMAHAATAFFLSPFISSLIVTFDSRGDFKSGTVWLADRHDGLRLIASTSMLHSVGALYSSVTKFLGFIPDRHEGKVMGLAAYGDYRKTLPIFKRMIFCSHGRIKSGIGKYYTPFNSGKIPGSEKELRRYKKEDIAAGLQYCLETTIVSYLSPFIEKHKPVNICLAGGTFENVKLNQRIREFPGVNNVFVFPHMGDGGVGLGGAILRLNELGERISHPLKSVYLGPSFSGSEIKKALAKNKNLFYKNVGKKKTGLAAKYIYAGKIVGWFQGRMEFGPRALGSRSILAATTNPKIKDILNHRLHRTEFMPFAPVTISDKAAKCYIGWKASDHNSRFMTMCYSVRKSFKKQSPAVVHIDDTARPQVIFFRDNPEYYRVVKKYFQLSGIPCIINTSFNNHEEPIVCSPIDAVSSLLRNNIDVLFIGDFMVTLKSKR